MPAYKKNKRTIDGLRAQLEQANVAKLNVFEKITQRVLTGHEKNTGKPYVEARALANDIAERKQQHLAAQKLQLWLRRQRASIIHKKQYGFSLSQQNKSNQRQRELKLQKLCEKNHGFKRIQEKFLSETAPQLMAVHNCTDTAVIQKAGAVLSITERQRQGGVVNNSNTVSNAALNDVVYTVVGFPGLSRAGFLAGPQAAVKVKLGAMPTQQQAHFKGLWSGLHFPSLSNVTTLPPLRFGNITRVVRLDCDERIAYYEYYDAEQKLVNARQRSFADSIVSAEYGVADFNQGLLAELLQELEYLGDFKEYVLDRLDEPGFLGKVFNAMFESQYFLEGRVITKIPLDHDYVEVQEKPHNHFQQYHALLKAVLSGDTLQVQSLLDLGVDINIDDGSGKNVLKALLMAETKVPGSLAMAKFLLTNGADIKGTNQSWTDDSVLGLAMAKMPELVDFLLAQGRSVAGIAEVRELPALATHQYLLKALRMGDEALFQKLRQLCFTVPMDLDIVSAAYNAGLTDLALSLLDEVTISPDQKYYSEDCIFMRAAENGDVGTLQVLLNKGFNIDSEVAVINGAVENKSGWNALFFAASHGSEKVVKFLLEHEINVSHVSKQDTNVIDVLENPVLDATFGGFADIPGMQEKLLQDARAKKLSETQSCKDIITAHCSQKNIEIASLPKQLKKLVSIKEAGVLCMISKTEQPKVLLIRRGNLAGQPTGHYCMPGGLRDMSDENLGVTAMREAIEETMVSVDQSPQMIVRCEEENETARKNPEDLAMAMLRPGIAVREIVERRRSICEFHQVRVASESELTASDDVVEACWVALSDIKVNENGAALYNGVRIQPSNWYVINCINKGVAVDQKKLQDLLVQERSVLKLDKNDLNNEEKLKKYCDDGMDVNRTDLLKDACLREDRDRVMFLIKELQADLNSSPSILNSVIVEEKYNMVRYLIKDCGASVNIESKDSSIWFFLYANRLRGDAEKSERALAFFNEIAPMADLNLLGAAVLRLITISNDILSAGELTQDELEDRLVTMVDEFIGLGGDLNKVYRFGVMIADALLHASIKYSLFHVAEALLEKGVDPFFMVDGKDVIDSAIAMQNLKVESSLKSPAIATMYYGRSVPSNDELNATKKSLDEVKSKIETARADYPALDATTFSPAVLSC